MNIDFLPRIRLAQLPTPVDVLSRLSETLGGPRILVKRDDQTGLAGGGNKTRKLEFLVADALAQEADVLVTAGAAQSNHCRQTAAAAAKAGLGCVLVLGGEAPAAPNGNLLLDQLLGAQIHWSGAHRKGEDLETVAESLRREGRKPYVVPYGGSNAIGAVGYALAMRELARHKPGEGSIENIDHIVFATSSGGTQAGLMVGARLVGYTGQVVGIDVDKRDPAAPDYPAQLAQLANETVALLGLHTMFSPREFNVVGDYAGAGYGVVGNLEREAIQLVGRLEGLLLDPVYTGRAMGGLIDLIRSGAFRSGETVLFWHTGGTPALFSYADALI
jgi:L-cysteate sulfo-lyase